MRMSVPCRTGAVVLLAAVAAAGMVSCGSDELDRHSACDQMSQVLSDFQDSLHRVSSGAASSSDVAPALADEGGKLHSIAEHSPGDLHSIGLRLSDLVATARVDLLEHHDSASVVSDAAVADTQLRDACRQ